MVASAPSRRTRSGGGAARRAERTTIKMETAKYIERNIPLYEILTEEALEIIETNAETVLEEIGINFVNNPAALSRWRDAGADVSGERVRIPRGLARQLCQTAPSRYTNTPAIRPVPSKLVAIRWFVLRFTARRLCATLPVADVMRRLRLSKVCETWATCQNGCIILVGRCVSPPMLRSISVISICFMPI